MLTTQPEPTHPDGETCASCVHFKRCKWLLSYDGTETQCDWAPSRFRAAPEQAKEGRKHVRF